MLGILKSSSGDAGMLVRLARMYGMLAGMLASTLTVFTVFSRLGKVASGARHKAGDVLRCRWDDAGDAGGPTKHLSRILCG